MAETMHIPLPPAVLTALDSLYRGGFEGYVVGGCVRDALMGQSPKDFDIATDALPEEVKQVFAERRVWETGLRHGTVTVMVDGTAIEITTYRVDGPYSDSRRPDTVHFTRSLEQDLARRDFTVNAMAYAPHQGLTDPWEGRRDMENAIIRCVGEPDRRFNEDALRILRGLRFAARLGFAIEPSTAASMDKNRRLLLCISRERIAAELSALLCGEVAGAIWEAYLPIFAVFLPLASFDPHTPQGYDRIIRTRRVLDGVPPLPHLRLAALLHTMGGQTARQTLTDLKMDRWTIGRVFTLVKLVDQPIPSKRKAVRRWLHHIGPEPLLDLLALQRGCALAQGPGQQGALLANIDQAKQWAETLLAQKDCFTLKALAVTGDDLRALGVNPGPDMGELLERLLALVMDEAVPNDREALLAQAGRLLADSSPQTPYSVYILRCGDGTFYTGCTNDLEKRIAAHNAGKGAKYTQGRLPVALAYSEAAADKSAALRRERAIKSLTRAQKQALIDGP